MSELNQFYNKQILEQIAEIEQIKNKTFQELHKDLDTLINGESGIIESNSALCKIETRQVLHNLINEIKRS